MTNPKATNYIPDSMSFSPGFFGPQGDVGYFMRFDQEKAESIVKELLAEGAKIIEAVGGLDGDFRENSSTIYDSDGFHNYDAYESSCWAEPILIVNFSDRPSEMYPVWTREERTEP